MGGAVNDQRPPPVDVAIAAPYHFEINRCVGGESAWQLGGGDERGCAALAASRTVCVIVVQPPVCCLLVPVPALPQAPIRPPEGQPQPAVFIYYCDARYNGGRHPRGMSPSRPCPGTWSACSFVLQLLALLPPCTCAALLCVAGETTLVAGGHYNSPPLQRCRCSISGARGCVSGTCALGATPCCVTVLQVSCCGRAGPLYHALGERAACHGTSKEPQIFLTSSDRELRGRRVTPAANSL
jgi:hypothetical protein